MQPVFQQCQISFMTCSWQHNNLCNSMQSFSYVFSHMLWTFMREHLCTGYMCPFMIMWVQTWSIEWWQESLNLQYQFPNSATFSLWLPAVGIVYKSTHNHRSHHSLSNLPLKPTSFATDLECQPSLGHSYLLFIWCTVCAVCGGRLAWRSLTNEWKAVGFIPAAAI